MTDNGKDKIVPWIVRKTDLVLDTQWARVRKDVCELPSGEVIPDYYYWQGGDFAMVFALTSADQVLLTRQYKHGVKEIVTELPAGLIDSTDKGPLAAIQRELREETGFAGEDWTPLGRLNLSAAKATTRAFPFLLKRAAEVDQPHPESTEDIELLFESVENVLGLISDGTIRDTSSVATILLALRALGRI